MREVVSAGGEGLMLHRASALWSPGRSDALRESPPPLGAMVTYRYRGLTPKGVPRFASFWRLATGDE